MKLQGIFVCEQTSLKGYHMLEPEDVNVAYMAQNTRDLGGFMEKYN